MVHRVPRIFSNIKIDLAHDGQVIGHQYFIRQ
jgi:hypothetical protein